MDVLTMSALAEPNRLRIVELLRDKPHPVGEIATRLALRQPQVSKHLKVLSEAGLVGVRPVANQRIYDNMGNNFEYVYDLEGDTLTIWGGERDSPAYYRGTWSKDGNTNVGAWVYPGGGGYRSTMTRM